MKTLGLWVLSALGFVAVLSVTLYTRIPIAEGPLPRYMLDVTSSSGWSVAGRDALSVWLANEMPGFKINAGPGESRIRINLKTPLGYLPAGDPELHRTNIPVWTAQDSGLQLALPKTRLDFTVIECSVNGVWGVCDVWLSINPLSDRPASLTPVWIGPRQILLTEEVQASESLGRRLR